MAPKKYATMARRSLKEADPEAFEQMRQDGTLEATVAAKAEETFNAVDAMMDSLIAKGADPGTALVEAEAAVIPDLLLTKDAETEKADVSGYDAPSRTSRPSASA